MCQFLMTLAIMVAKDIDGDNLQSGKVLDQRSNNRLHVDIMTRNLAGIEFLRTTQARDRSSLAVEYIEKLKRELQGAQPAPGLEEVRRRLAKIPGSMAAEIIAERGDRMESKK
jgi:hypothetical protein